ncbi:hypothetical protein [Leisingera sp. F5]|uniref:hypothetical protein n=1 Tax=Leisingera sp. F5 TaxID=1813816 RepID=UPI0025BF6786|nr:hypothetical protein [Leisingera sp. F5]
MDLYQEALRGAAELVQRYGEEFLPFFLRMEAAVAELEGQGSAIDRALALCGKVQGGKNANWSS